MWKSGNLEIWKSQAGDLAVREGDRLLDKLSGTYSLLLWDKEARRGMLVRDALGTRPLFFTGDGRNLAFASEIRSLLELLGRRQAPDQLGLAHWLSRRLPPPELTLFEGVQRLPAGHLLRIDANGYRAERWWQPRYRPPPTTRSWSA